MEYEWIGELFRNQIKIEKSENRSRIAASAQKPQDSEIFVQTPFFLLQN